MFIKSNCYNYIVHASYLYITQFKCDKYFVMLISLTVGIVWSVLRRFIFKTFSFFGTDSNYESFFWVHCGTSIATCVSDFNWAIKTKCRNWKNYATALVTFIDGCRHFDSHKYKRIIAFHISLYQIYFYINIISFVYLWVLKNKIFEYNWKSDFSEDGCVCLILAMATDACWVGHCCVEPGVLVSNHVFLCLTWHFFCPTRLFVSNRCSYP